MARVRAAASVSRSGGVPSTQEVRLQPSIVTVVKSNTSQSAGTKNTLPSKRYRESDVRYIDRPECVEARWATLHGKGKSRPEALEDLKQNLVKADRLAQIVPQLKVNQK